MTRPTHFSWIYCSHNIGRTVQIIEILSL
jgi:hypothetical protein